MFGINEKLFIYFRFNFYNYQTLSMKDAKYQALLTTLL